ncbi:MAG: glycosyltransferase family 1 protein [Thermoleophilia bacterium]|nr:glycosyltransferase family 1 protein [Thermoleophilia bacterium]
MLHIGINGRAIFRQLTGVQHYAREVTRALCLLTPAEATFTVFSGREGRGSTDGLPIDSSPVPAGGPVRGLIWEQTVLRRMAKKAAVDVLFSPANVAPLNAPCSSVVTIHDLSFLLFPEYFSRTFGTYYRAIIPRIIDQATAVITDSENSKADLITHLGVDPEKITAIHLGVSPEFRKRIKKADLEAARLRLGLPPKFFLSVASLEPRKNLGNLVKAYAMLPAEVKEELKLVLVGAGNRIFSDPAIASALNRLPAGSVVTPGYIAEQDLPAVYRLSTALVFPSLYEGFGLPVLEAMAASTPVISSNRSSLPEVTGAAAALIDPESTEQLAAAMELLAQDSGTRNLLIERGKKRAGLFTWKKTAEKTLEVLRGAAGH